MTNNTTKSDSLQPAAEMAVDLFDNWFDPIETEVRARSRQFIEELLRGELDAALARPRYGRSQTAGNEGRADVTGHRHGSRTRSLTGTFGPIEIAVPRARLTTSGGGTAEWKSQALRAYQRRTLAADALIASTYLAGTNTRRVRRALAALFGGTVGKDTVSRTWRKVKSDWDAWNTRSLAEEPIVRLILDGTVVRVRLDRKATSISLLVVLGVRADGQKVLLAIKSMGGESAEAWRTVLDDLIKRGLRRPEFLIVDGAPGLDKAIASVWDGVPVQRCTVHKLRNLIAHAPERLHDEITADYNDMIYATTPEEIAVRRKAFIRKWRLKHRAVTDSLMAYSKSIPILTFVQTGIKRQGMLSNRFEWPAIEADLSPDVLRTEAFRQIFEEWLLLVTRKVELKSKELNVGDIKISTLLTQLDTKQAWAAIVIAFGIVSGIATTAFKLGQTFP